MGHYLYINKIMARPSLCDGPGYRVVLFLQGCNIKCEGCQNPSTWDINLGKKVECKLLANKIRSIAKYKALTISGGEPLMQQDELPFLLEELKDFDLCLYTGYDLSDVPNKILKHLHWIKTGKYIKELKTTTKPFVGSKNQEMWEVKNVKIIGKR